MTFQRGQSGNPKGRPKGSCGGRMKALAELDRLLARSKNRKLLAKALEAEFREDPARFFKAVIMPLLPRDAKVAVESGVIEWRSLLEAGAPRAGERG